MRDWASHTRENENTFDLSSSLHILPGHFAVLRSMACATDAIFHLFSPGAQLADANSRKLSFRGFLALIQCLYHACIPNTRRTALPNTPDRQSCQKTKPGLCTWAVELSVPYGCTERGSCGEAERACTGSDGAHDASVTLLALLSA